MSGWEVDPTGASDPAFAKLDGLLGKAPAPKRVATAAGFRLRLRPMLSASKVGFKTTTLAVTASATSVPVSLVLTP